MFENTREACENASEEQVTIDVNRRTEKVDRFDANKLSDMIDMSSQEGDSITVRVLGTTTGREYARIEYVVFEHESISLIEYMSVNKSFQNEGIATNLRLDTVESLSHVDYIYSKITNEKLISVARRQGFREFSGGNNSWFVRDQS